MSRRPVDQNHLGYCAFRIAGGVLPRVPETVAYSLAPMLGTVYRWFLPHRWDGVASNISHVLGKRAESPEVCQVVGRVCQNLACNFYDLFRVPYLSTRQLGELMEVQGWEHVEAARERRRGVVMAAAHFGSLEIGLQIGPVRELPMTIPAEHLRPERLYRYVCSLRTGHGRLRLVPADGSLLPLYRALRRNEAVALAADRNSNEYSGREVEFFGSPTRLPDGHVRLALRTGAALIAAFMYRRPGGRLLICFEPVPLESQGDAETRVARGMQALITLLEDRIRSSPEQWVITVPVWDSPWNGTGS
jgi:KDO2-lipid IV(A) lauroyltransferase